MRQSRDSQVSDGARWGTSEQVLAREGEWTTDKVISSRLDADTTPKHEIEK